MIKVKTKAKRRELTRVFSVPLESTTFMIVIVAVVIFVGTALIMLGMRNLKLVQENRWLENNIGRMRLEIKGLKTEIDGILSKFEVIDLDGK